LKIKFFTSLFKKGQKTKLLSAFLVVLCNKLEIYLDVFMIIPIVIPARNEETRLEKTIDSIRNMFRFAGMEPYIVVVDDGSKDQTPILAEKLGCFVVRLNDRGYSALGMPVLADTHNAGFEFINQNLKEDYKYLMVIGSDTEFANDYLRLLLNEMEIEPQLAMCSGVLDGFKTNPMAVRGSGRIIRRTFWEKAGSKLPNFYYAWESYPIVLANSMGLKTRTIYEARMQTDRPPMRSVDWKRYGIGMQENGSLFVYVLLRAIRTTFKVNLKSGIRLIYGYFAKTEQRFPPELRAYVSNYQKRRILTFLKLRS